MEVEHRDGRTVEPKDIQDGSGIGSFVLETLAGTRQKSEISCAIQWPDTQRKLKWGPGPQSDWSLRLPG